MCDHEAEVRRWGGNIKADVVAYVGQWCNGYMHRKGSLIWCNGNRYDGVWENGRPMGNGSFRWEDGGLYIRIWSRDEDVEEDLKGIYYNSGNGWG